MPVLTELEAAIVSDPDDLENYAVYGDWLVEQGDPRGELIATQLASEAGDPEMKRAALRVFAKHRDQFIGELGSMIAARAFVWRAGFIESAVLTPDALLIEGGERVATSIAEVATRLLAHPSARFLVSLTIASNDRGPWGQSIGSQREVVDRIVAAKPLVLRRLRLGDLQYGVSKIGNISHVSELATLHGLVVEGELSLGKFALPELRSISLEPFPLRRRGGREIVEASWPKLRSLRLHLRDYPDHVGREMRALVHRTDMPELRELSIVGLRTTDELVEDLVYSPMLPRLRVLELSPIGKRGQRAIAKHRDAFKHVDLREVPDRSGDA